MNPPVGNSEKNPDGTPMDNSQNYTAEYVEDLKHKAANTSSENTVLQEVIKVQNSDDNNYLLELHAENPAMAWRVAKQMGYELDNALDLVNTALETKNPSANKDNPPQFNEEDIINKAVDKINGDKVKKFENKFFDDLPENTREEVKKTYKEISWKWSKTQEQAKRLLDMASVYVNKDNKTDKEKEFIPHSPMSVWWGNRWVTKPNTVIAPETQKLAKDLWVEHLI